MDETVVDLNRALMIDGNGVAGVLTAIFGVELTDVPSECAHCGNVGEMGALLAFIQGPGIVLRCSVCEQVVIRIVETPSEYYLDARGATYLRLPRLGG